MAKVRALLRRTYDFAAAARRCRSAAGPALRTDVQKAWRPIGGTRPST